MDWAVLAWSTLRNNTGTSENRRTARAGLNPLVSKGHIWLNKLPYVLRKSLQTAYKNKIDLCPENMTAMVKKSVLLVNHPGLPRKSFANLSCLWKSRGAKPDKIKFLHKRVCKRWPSHSRRIDAWKHALMKTTWIGEKVINLTIEGDHIPLLSGRITPLRTLSVNPKSNWSILSWAHDEKRGWIRKSKLTIRGGTRTLQTPQKRNGPCNHLGHEMLWTDGSSSKNGDANSRVGAGVWNETLRVGASYELDSTSTLDNNSGEIMALALALE